MYDDELDGDEYDFETSGDDILGDDVLGDMALVGARRGRRRRIARRRRRRMRRKPSWRNRLAPGVPLPGEGLEPLPLVPSANNGIFNAATPLISFTARPQAPFRAERLLATVRRTGAAGILVLANNIFIGRELQLVQTGSFDIEFFSPTAFGVRLNLVASTPGIDIRIDCAASAVVPAMESLACSLMFLGRTIR